MVHMFHVAGMMMMKVTTMMAMKVTMVMLLPPFLLPHHLQQYNHLSTLHHLQQYNHLSTLHHLQQYNHLSTLHPHLYLQTSAIVVALMINWSEKVHLFTSAQLVLSGPCILSANGQQLQFPMLISKKGAIIVSNVSCRNLPTAPEEAPEETNVENMCSLIVNNVCM